MRKALLIIAATVLSIAILAGCGYSKKSNKPYSGAPTGNGSALNKVSHSKLGNIVVDSKGFTLYRFDADTNNPPASHCTNSCAALWPPSTSSVALADVPLNGIDRTKVGFVMRPDGSQQLTIAGWPVYRYAKDTKPGNTKGQGVDGTWFAITPEGNKATKKKPTKSKSGY